MWDCVCVWACVHLHGRLGAYSWDNRDSRTRALFSNNLVAGNRKLVSIAGKYSFQIPCGAVVLTVWFLNPRAVGSLRVCLRCKFFDPTPDLWSHLTFLGVLGVGAQAILCFNYPFPWQVWYAKASEPLTLEMSSWSITQTVTDQEGGLGVCKRTLRPGSWFVFILRLSVSSSEGVGVSD